MKTDAIISHLTTLGTQERAEKSRYYFKTGPGEYGEGDIFIGITMPVLRSEAKQFIDTPLDDVENLLHSPIHEVRMFALVLLTLQFKKGDEAQKELIYDIYLKNSTYINNWDLVDVSAHLIVGPWLQSRDKAILTTLAQSDLLWERRIAMLATFCYIKQNQFDEALHIATLLQKDSEDLMHKAVGWMLREIGKRDLTVEEAFLQKHYHTMPRTMLRYAIERFEEGRRKAYLKGLV